MVDGGEVGPTLFELTDVTGRRRRETREIVVQGWEVNLQVAWSVGLSLLGAAPTLPLLVGVFGQFAVPIFLVVTCGVYWLFFYRQAGGLRTSPYQVLRARRAGRHRSFFVGLTAANVGDLAAVRLVSRSAPVHSDRLKDLF